MQKNRDLSTVIFKKTKKRPNCAGYEISVGEKRKNASFSNTRGKVIHSLGVLSTNCAPVPSPEPAKNGFFVDRCRVQGKLSTGCPQYVDKSGKADFYTVFSALLL